MLLSVAWTLGRGRLVHGDRVTRATRAPPAPCETNAGSNASNERAGACSGPQVEESVPVPIPVSSQSPVCRCGSCSRLLGYVGSAAVTTHQYTDVSRRLKAAAARASPPPRGQDHARPATTTLDRFPAEVFQWPRPWTTTITTAFARSPGSRTSSDYRSTR